MTAGRMAEDAADAAGRQRDGVREGRKVIYERVSCCRCCRFCRGAWFRVEQRQPATSDDERWEGEGQPMEAADWGGFEAGRMDGGGNGRRRLEEG